MKVYKHKFMITLLLSATVAFGQKQAKKIDESFTVNTDVIVEIKAINTDISVETWNNNIVAISGVWQEEGLTKEEIENDTKLWNFEALGNKSKVVITSKPAGNYYFSSEVFEDIDIDFDIESFAFIGELHNGDYFSDLPSMPPIPDFPESFIEHLTEIEFDHDAYLKDKEGYMKEFQKRQEAWEDEFEKKLEPQMKAYEESVKKWEKEVEPQMKAYEEKLKKWEKNVEPQMKAQEKKLEEKMEKMEKEMEAKYSEKMEAKNAELSDKFKIKKKLVIKVPKGATLKVDTHHGKISLPKGIKTINYNND